MKQTLNRGIPTSDSCYIAPIVQRPCGSASTSWCIRARSPFDTICGRWRPRRRRRRRWNDRKLFTQNETLPNHSFLHVLIDAKAIVLDNHIEIWTNATAAMFTWRLCLHNYACWWCKFNCVVSRLLVLYIRFQFTLFHWFCFLHLTSLSCPFCLSLCLYNSFHFLSLPRRFTIAYWL